MISYVLFWSKSKSFLWNMSFQHLSDVTVWCTYVNVFCLALIWLTAIPQTLKQGESRGLLYRVQWAGRSNFTPRSWKAMQFTCSTALLIVSSVANGIIAVSFLRSNICYFHTLSDISDMCKVVCSYICTYMYVQNPCTHKRGCNVFIIWCFL